MCSCSNTPWPTVAAAGDDDLLDVDVFQRQRVELAVFPALAADGQLAVPLAVAPLRVLVAQALHAVQQQRLKVDLHALAGAGIRRIKRTIAEVYTY